MSDLIGILGDSWGCGEWNFVVKNNKKNFQVTHNGIHAYFIKEKKYSVKNFSTPNSGLLHCIDMCKKNISILKKCKIIFVFVTDSSRDIPVKEFWQKNYTVEDYKNRNTIALQRFTQTVDQLQISNIKLIGGLSILNDQYTKKCNNLEFAFNAFDLLVPDIQGYEMNFEDHLRPMFKTLDRSVIDYVYTQQKIWESIQKQKIMIPDGHHPNRHGHKIIFDELVKKYNL